MYLTLFFILVPSFLTMKRITHKLVLPSSGIGTTHTLTVHQYGKDSQSLTPIPGIKSGSIVPQKGNERIYIQASLHADELPGLLVIHHLIRKLDLAQAENRIEKEILIVPYANPIGLNQIFLGSHIGRFSLATGTNFNRDYVDVTSNAIKRLLSEENVNLLSNTDSLENVRQARLSLEKELDALTDIRREEAVMKKMLFKMAISSDIVLDLHCDTDAVMHMYTHDRLWPQLRDLAALLESQCNIVASRSGGNPFDEACSCPWADLQDALQPNFPLPVACQSVTVELRGESDVYDHLAEKDAAAIMNFMELRGFIKPTTSVEDSIVDDYPVPATPLTGVDMIECEAAGVIAWKVKPGERVEVGQVLGEIVSIDDFDKERIPIITRTAGLVFGMRRHKLARPGEIVIKVAGDKPLEWRKGNLLTS